MKLFAFFLLVFFLLQEHLCTDYALGGVDVVAYFSQLRPGSCAIKGKEDYQFNFRNATWLFSSADNLKAFQNNSSYYAPQYGGFWAWAAAEESKIDEATVAPDVWNILNSKLYLNWSSVIQKLWVVDPSHFIKVADARWIKQYGALDKGPINLHPHNCTAHPLSCLG